MTNIDRLNDIAQMTPSELATELEHSQFPLDKLFLMSKVCAALRSVETPAERIAKALIAKSLPIAWQTDDDGAKQLGRCAKVVAEALRSFA